MYIKCSILLLTAIIFISCGLSLQQLPQQQRLYENERQTLMEILRKNGILPVLTQTPKPILQYTNMLNQRFPMQMPSNQFKSKEPACGAPRITNFVAGGRDANDQDYPWHVQIMIFNHENGASETFCGGTVISPNHVITAAHCYDEMTKNLAESTHIIFRGLGVQRFDARVHDVIINEDYVPAMGEFEAKMKKVKPGPTNDLAILVLKPLPENIRQRIIPACLPSEEAEIDEGIVCKVMGHGFTSRLDESTFTMPSKLQIADVRISSNEDCKSDVESQTIKDKISDVTCCVRGPIQPCVGDSGGPLICSGSSPDTIEGAQEDEQSDEFVLSSKFKPRRFYLVGITSFAVSTDENDTCGEFKSAVFGLTTKHHDWIRRIINDRSLLPNQSPMQPMPFMQPSFGPRHF